MRANFVLGQETENANTEAKYGCFPLTKLSRKFAARVPEAGYRTGLKYEATFKFTKGPGYRAFFCANPNFFLKSRSIRDTICVDKI